MKDSKNLVIGLLCAVVCIMAVAYAAFSTTLNITGTATISSEWDVQITGITCDVDYVEGGAVAPNDEEGNSTAAVSSFNGTTAQFDFQFYQPGDVGHCDVTITNGGTIAAKVNSISVATTDKAGASTTLTDNAIKYSVSGITDTTKLSASGTNTYSIDAEFVGLEDDNGQSLAIPDAATKKTLTVAIEYVQDFSA